MEHLNSAEESEKMEVDETLINSELSSQNSSNELSCENTEPDSGFSENIHDKRNENDTNITKEEHSDDKNVKQKSKSKIKIIYSESESNDDSKEEGESDVNKIQNNEEENSVRKNKFTSIENATVINESTTKEQHSDNKNVKQKSKGRIKIIYSESESDDDDIAKKDECDYDVSKVQNEEDNDNKEVENSVRKNKFKLIDSDDDDDQIENVNKGEEIAKSLLGDESDENKEEGIIVRKKHDDNKEVESSVRKNKFKLIDSDDDESENINKEEEIAKSLLEDENDENKEKGIIVRKKHDNNKEVESSVRKNKFKLIDSDDDDESENINKGEEQAKSLLDDESDENKEEGTSIRKSRFKLLDSDEDEENEKENDITTKINNEQILENDMQKKLSTLCDSESSDDEINDPVNEKARSPVFDDNEDELKSSNKGKKVNRKSSGEDSSSQIKKMTAKEAELQRKEIQSESQRMTRESDARLPYHRPKQRTLKEFLAQRKKFSESVDIPIEKKLPSMCIKMTNQHIELISKKLEEREKEAIQFFKSDSEPEEDDDDKSDEDYVPDGDETETNNEAADSQERTIISEATIEHLLNTENEDAQVFNIEENCDNKDNTKSDENNKIDCDTSIADTVNAIVEKLNENNQEFMDFEDDVDPNIDSLKIDITKEKSMCDSNVACASNLEDSLKTKANSSNMDEEETQSKLDNPADADLQDQSTIEDEKLANKSKSDDPTNEDLENLNEQLDSIVANSIQNNSHDFLDLKENESQEIDINSLALIIEDPEKIREQKKLERKKLLLEQIGNTEPKLSGGPNYIIDLEENTTKPDEVTQLMERFIHHNTKKKPHKHKVELSIVTVTGAGEIRKEKMSVELEDHNAETVVVETPGEKLKKLRVELEKQMAEQRTKMWEQRMSKKNSQDEEEEEDGDMAVYKGEKDGCCDGGDEEEVGGDDCDKEETNEMDVDDVNDEDDDDDVNDEDDDDDEEKEDDNDQEGNMLDGEAVEDDEEDNEEEDNNEEEEYDGESENEEEEKKELLTRSAKKRLKRIIMNDDSESEEDDDNRVPSRGANKTASTESWESQIQLGQKQMDYTPEKSQYNTKPVLGLLTPVCNLTGLQSLNSGSKFLHESPKRSSLQLPPDPSPLKGWQKELFPEQGSRENDSDDEMEENPQTQLNQSRDILEPELPPTTQDLLDLCSGKFTGFTQQQKPALGDKNDEMEENTQTQSNQRINALEPELPPTTQDLLDLCSGKFDGFTQQQNLSEKSTRNDFENSSLNNSLSNIDSFQNETSIRVNEFQVPKVPEVTASFVDDDDDKLISQILDEEEMEAFKKKFVSPVTKPSQVNKLCNAGISASIKFDSDEDDEEEDDDDMVNVKKKKVKNPAALIDSDEEEVTEEAEDFNKEDDDDEEGEANELADEDEGREVEYDSEENEIEIGAEAKPKKLKLQDFFENEAELSESEWGSADEDEKNLDEMDIELGDEDQFDQNKVRRDLEKIHMRQLLDEDKREVKILQELLLEDGELHGTGRQRQFRWKNIEANSIKPDENTPHNENEDCLSEDDENEEEWRKKRFEREEFLRTLQKEEDEEQSPLGMKTGSQVFKLGHKFVLKNKVQVEKKVTVEPVQKLLQPMQTMRGSFLARTDQVLARVAEYTKEATKTTVPGGAATSKKHFVFHTVSVDKTLDKDKKRKASEVGTPQAIKKMRIENLSPALKKSGNNRLKKLFSNL